ncbi:MAG: SRPBCC family protein, partial [Acidimicrobiia bacterium]|nr:SRPBCC family protein [Acidimicrobiia bacterium]
MSRITVSIDLDATPARVWEVVEPIERHVDWMADAVAIRFEGDQTR